MNIIFMGTPDFAVPTLRRLIDSADHNVKAVFTREPKPQGRGMKLSPSPVHQIAQDHGVDVYTPKTLRNTSAVELINSIEADIIIVVAYGFIIPPDILSAKKYGCLNIHPSKLPKYRGAAPLQRTLINNEKETSVCVMQMDAGVDTGDILMQQDLFIDADMTLLQLHDECAKMGADLLLKTLANIDNIKPIKQQEEGVTYANKLRKEEGEIFWQSDDINVIYGKIRGMNPWPGAYFKLQNQEQNQGQDQIIKITQAKVISADQQGEVGTVLNQQFDVVCKNGILRILAVKPEGKAEMSGEAFLRGRNIIKL